MSNTPPPAPNPGGGGSALMAATIVTIADSPADRVVSFELTVNSVTLTKSDSSIVQLLSAPRRVEITHVSGSAEPLTLQAIPQGTYTSMSIVVSAPEVVFIDNAGHTVQKEDQTFTKTINITFNPALQAGATPVVLTIDVDARGSLIIDAVNGNVTVNPVAVVSLNNIAEQQNEQEVENGELEHIVGQVTASSSNSFTIQTGAGSTIPFTTNSTTEFEGVTGAANLTINMLVRVEGRTAMDGSAVAKEVEVLSPDGMEAEGIVTSTTGNPVTSFNVVAQDGSGNGMTSSMKGAVLTVNVNNGTRFRVDEGNVDLGGLTLPTFDASTLSKGQRLEAESDAAAVNGVLTAESVKLQQQALVGAISAISGMQFTLTVPDDSAFKLLTGKNTLTVLTQSKTRMKNNVTITQGAVVKVRGLVFFETARAAYTMVAGRISTP
jgi:hypothetical protein